ncbi:MAG: hypothetical protein ACR2OR_00430 [Hyphomicrobiales bacterium]
MLKLVALSMLAASSGAEPLSCGPHIIVAIKESSPDLVSIRNASSPGWILKELSIDFAPSQGRVFVDYGLDGATETPFSSNKTGQVRLEKLSGADGGSQKLGMVFSGFEAPETFHMLIDFDNHDGAHEFGGDYIDPVELDGATFTAILKHEQGKDVTAKGAIGSDGTGSIGGGGCV